MADPKDRDSKDVVFKNAYKFGLKAPGVGGSIEPQVPHKPKHHTPPKLLTPGEGPPPPTPFGEAPLSPFPIPHGPNYEEGPPPTPTPKQIIDQVHDRSNTLTSGPLAEAAKVAKDTFKDGLSEKLLDPKGAPNVNAQKVDLDKGFTLKP